MDTQKDLSLVRPQQCGREPVKWALLVGGLFSTVLINKEVFLLSNSIY